MNKQEEMQAIVEAAGECWHVCRPPNRSVCVKCGHVAIDSILYDTAYACDDNPESEDLNELFQLAEKLGYDYRLSCTQSLYLAGGKYDCIVIKEDGDKHLETTKTPADALRKALYQAVVKGE